MPVKYRKLPEVSPQDRERFWRLVDKRGPDDCWLWLGGKNPKRGNYGRFWIARVEYRTNRMAFWLHYRIDLGADDACHRCDNPPCCNPAHLFKGTRAVNLADMTAKNRRVYGSQHGIAKLTEQDVAEIKARYKPRSKDNTYSLAKEFGVCQMTINNIIHRKIWKGVKAAHITPSAM